MPAFAWIKISSNEDLTRYQKTRSWCVYIVQLKHGIKSCLDLSHRDFEFIQTHFSVSIQQCENEATSSDVIYRIPHHCLTPEITNSIFSFPEYDTIDHNLKESSLNSAVSATTTVSRPFYVQANTCSIHSFIWYLKTFFNFDQDGVGTCTKRKCYAQRDT